MWIEVKHLSGYATYQALGDLFYCSGTVLQRIIAIMAWSPRRTRTVVVLVLVGLLIVAVRFVIVWGNRPFFPTVSAVKQIRLPSGQTVYLKRLATSMNYDHVSLSLNGDRCKDEDPKTDFRFRSMSVADGATYYAAGDNTLTIFAPLDEPTQLKWPFEVRQETLPFKVEQDPQGSGVSMVEIRVGELTSCP